MRRPFYAIVVGVSLSLTTLAYSQTIGSGASSGNSVGAGSSIVNSGGTGLGASINAGTNGSATGNGSALSTGTTTTSSSNASTTAGDGSSFNSGTTTGASVNNTFGNNIFGVVGLNDALPTGATSVSRGQLVDINENNNTISVRDSATGMVNVRSVHDAHMLNGLKRGDTVQVFSENNTQ